MHKRIFSDANSVFKIVQKNDLFNPLKELVISAFFEETWKFWHTFTMVACDKIYF